MNNQFKLTALSTFLLLSGCAGVPEYHPPPGTATARLNLRGTGSKWICVDGKPQRLVADSKGYADIPTGNRLTIGSSFYNYVYGGVSTSCNPRSSIIPQEGRRYYIDFEIEAEHCTAFIFKEDETNRTGLALDSTFGRPSDCYGK